MTDSSDPRRSKSSRKRHSREPATIDLKATVIDDGTIQDSAQGSTGEDAAKDVHVHDAAAQDVVAQEAASQESPLAETPQGAPLAETSQEARPEETIAGSVYPTAEDVVASPEATLDSGTGTDTLPTGDPSVEPLTHDTVSQGGSFQGGSFQESASQEPPSQDASLQDPPSGTVPPQPPPERRSSAGALIGSGLLGGLVGAGLVYGLQTWQAPPAQDDQRLVQLEQRVSALRQPSPGQPQGNTQALEERLQALEAARGSLDGRLQAVQGTAEQAASQAQEALNRPAPEAAPGAAAPQNEAALNDLSTRLAALEEQVRTSTQNAATMANATQDLDRRLADQDRRLGEQAQRFTQLDGRFAEVERRFTESERRFGETDRRFSEQEQRLAALSRQVAENGKAAEAAGQTGAKVVLAGRLNEALSSGEPYAEVLEGVRKAGADAARIAPLEPFAGQGAPTPAKLAEDFEPLETKILRESRGPANDWTDRILRMADRVVTVRPVNEQDSTGVSGLVARIRQALEAGDVADAAAAWDALPEPSRRISEEWGRQVKAVAQAHQAAQAIGSDALATLNRTTQ
ncbi:hypothetical protein JKG68_28460 [Microvirga aerilata]|uniref:Uncharacterized protein n=1 Tax=Microvirga aerilata TaxID=670292 RepID=A0A936ZNJ1_9HYPH|nr:hypothetical protein [Microvirga aerilata]MBL0407843.1 hypothetical protein [Microvirga aerilata]